MMHDVPNKSSSKGQPDSLSSSANPTRESSIGSEGNSAQSPLHTTVVSSTDTENLATPIVTTQPGDEGSNPDEEKIEVDSLSQRVACLVHAALVFFCLLIGVAVVMVISIVQQYGLLALALTSFLVVAVLGLAFFLDMVMKEDKKWKPIRKKIRHWQAVTKAVLVKEFREFQLDWNEYLLLTNGKAECDVQNDNISSATGKTKTKHRSNLFLLVKPLLRIRNIGRRKKHTATVTTYVPPVV